MRDRREDRKEWETEEKIAGSERQKRRLREVRDRREDCEEWETEEKIAASERQKRREDCGE